MKRNYPPCPRDFDGLSPRELEDRAAIAKPFKDKDGIEGRIEVHEIDAVYPYAHRARYVSFQPTARGKRTEAYRRVRRELRDDWSTDLKQSGPEVWADHIMRALRCAPR